MRFAMSDARKESLRMAFGKEDGEYGDSVMGLTLGMLGAESGSGRIRAARKKKEKRQGMHACMQGLTSCQQTHIKCCIHSHEASEAYNHVRNGIVTGLYANPGAGIASGRHGGKGQGSK